MEQAKGDYHDLRRANQVIIFKTEGRTKHAQTAHPMNAKNYFLVFCRCYQAKLQPTGLHAPSADKQSHLTGLHSP